uniref:RNA helicase n=1 Tax=Aegilops tauschii subsp. strangulata TaxID=200361 RepID=A0A453EES4_AEGTS
EQTVASRVAEEVGVKLGEEVGYTIRFEDETNPGMTMIKFLTDGVLIREMMEDPLLSKYSSVIMIDEAHERSISTDILLGLLKKIQRRRPELRLIISSATIEARSMSTFFSNRRKNSLLKPADGLPNPEPAILSVEGRGYTVETHYLEEPVSDYLQAAVNTVLIIHEKEPPGDILVFLTGQDDIDAALKLLNDEIQHLGKHYFDLVILPLYSGLPRGDQDLIFAPTSKGKRKVVISTNIAETSLTLEGVVYVVDSGFSKQKCYNPISDLESLVVAPISKASARQRAGRAGRVRPGKCFRLYTEEYYLNEMQSDGIPEMQRSNLVSCIIQLKALGIDNILGFDWPASPSPEAMIRALEILFSLGILDEDAKLTVPIGFQVAEMPLDPMISKMILSANDFGCSDEILTIAAFLSVQSVWVSMRGVKKEFDEAKLRFAAAEGDHVTFLNIYKGFHQSGKSSQWCYKNFLNHQALKKVIEIRAQLVRVMKRFGIQLKSCDRDMQCRQLERPLLLVRLLIHVIWRNMARMECIKQLGRHKKFTFIHLPYSSGLIRSGSSTSLLFQLTSTICVMLLPLNHHGLLKLHHISTSSEHPIQLRTNLTVCTKVGWALIISVSPFGPASIQISMACSYQILTTLKKINWRQRKNLPSCRGTGFSKLTEATMFVYNLDFWCYPVV